MRGTTHTFLGVSQVHPQLLTWPTYTQQFQPLSLNHFRAENCIDSKAVDWSVLPKQYLKVTIRNNYHNRQPCQTNKFKLYQLQKLSVSPELSFCSI